MSLDTRPLHIRIAEAEGWTHDQCEFDPPHTESAEFCVPQPDFFSLMIEHRISTWWDRLMNSWYAQAPTVYPPLKHPTLPEAVGAVYLELLRQKKGSPTP